MEDEHMADASSTATSAATDNDNNNKDDDKYQRWLQQLMASHEALRNNPAAAKVLRDFLNQIQAFHAKQGNHVLNIRGQQRTLMSQSQQAQLLLKSSTTSAAVVTADWFDFLQVSDKPRHSGPALLPESSPNSTATDNNTNENQCGRRRFETLSLKIGASRNKARFGVTDDTGYLFPCLQHYVPRACFLVTDHHQQQQKNHQQQQQPSNVFIIHGNKKFAGQGDDALEEEGTSSANSNSNTDATDLHNPPPKCFPGTAHLQPAYYIFTWKANGKNAGVFGYRDPYDNEKVWLFVNSKGVCECARLLRDVLLNKSSDNNMQEDEDKELWSDWVRQETIETCLLRQIFKAFRDVWNAPGVNHAAILSLWKQGYLLLFEFCDNKHVVLERGDGGRPIDHLAFIGLVKQPPLENAIDTYNSGVAFLVNNQFSFDWWKHTVRAPSFSSKPTCNVKVEDLENALQELMKGTFFLVDHSEPSTRAEQLDDARSWFHPNQHISDANSSFLTGEGAVCYEMASAKSGSDVIRQLFKAKSASYITHRQVRAFLSNNKKDEQILITFEACHAQVKKLCRRKFGDLNPDSPYPDIKTFCQAPPAVVVEAASLYYAHFSMWLQSMASKMKVKEADLITFGHPDMEVSSESNFGKKYQHVMGLLKLPNDQTTLHIRCGMAFRIAEFTAIFGLQHATVFAAPREMLQQIASLEGAKSGPSFAWPRIPTGYSGDLCVGFQHAFPNGAVEQPKMEKSAKKKQKKQRTGGNPIKPFRDAFSQFLLVNPGVKLKLSKENPDLFTLTSLSPKKVMLVSSPTTTEFEAQLWKLPHLDRPGETEATTKTKRTLSEPEAVAQAIGGLKREFSCVSEIFGMPAQLTFGDVTGRLFPIISPADAKKHMLIVRGYPGLGKSTIAKALQQLFGKASVPVIEADSFFGPHCPFSLDLLTAAHDDAQSRARAALEDTNAQLVVVSNTNTTAWEYVTYIRIAQESRVSVAVAILTLDTNVSFEEIDNIHEVPEAQVRKMATRLRLPDNTPEGKTLDEILAIADAQMTKIGVIPDPVVAWALLETGGQSFICDVWEAFVKFANSQHILISSGVSFQPQNAHVTQLYVRPSSSKEEHATVTRLWSHHGEQQSIGLGATRYQTIPIEGSENQKRFVNIAISVRSILPELVPIIETPHITIAFDPDYANAVDSRKLWPGNDEEKGDCTVATFDNFEQNISTSFSSTVEVGTIKHNIIRHERLPYWLQS